jgi:hypothetical protein
MKRTYWILGACLSLLLVGGFALDVSAQQQQQTPPATAPSAPSTPDTSTSPSTPPSPAPPSGTMQRDNPSATTPPATNNNTRIETRETERNTVTTPDSGRIFGLAPGVALLIGAALLVVIVVALVAMSKRSDEVTHTHRV